jgi:NAD(P)H-nitrite reductase large subunit
VIETRYLIVGNSAGGIGAAEAIREVDRQGSLIIISEEPYPAYSRPLLLEYLIGERSLSSMLFRPPEFYEENNITALLGRRAGRLNIEQHLAELEDGETIAWEKLLLATGGQPTIPPVTGLHLKGVFTFTTLDAARELGKSLEEAKRAVVIGSGLIGISVTEALMKRGLEVAVVVRTDRILRAILDEEASYLAGAALREAGVKLLTHHNVAEIVGKPSRPREVGGVVLDDGETVPCDLVVIAVGVTPRTELVSGTAVKVNQGIVVDRQMAASCPDVYSCGDVAEAYDFVWERNRVIPIWPNAYIGGRVAGYNLAGVKTEYPGGTAMNSLRYFGLPIIAAGMVSPPEGQGYEVLRRRDNHTYRKIVLKDNVVVGMVLVKAIERSGIIFGLMRDRVDVSEFKSALVAEDFGLASFPPQLWQRRLETPVTAGVHPASPSPQAKRREGGE